MSIENLSHVREIIIEEVFLNPITLEEARGRIVKDETGNPIRDEEGSVVFADDV